MRRSGPPTDSNACVIYQPQAHTAIYDTQTGKWTAGPNIPTHEGAGDTWASLLPDGNVFMQTNPPGTNQDRLAHAKARYKSIREHTLRPLAAAKEAAPGGFAPQATETCPPGFPLYKAYEFNGKSLIHEGVADFCGQPDLLLLPTGGVMMNAQVIYNGSGTFLNAWRPTIRFFSFSNNVNPGGTYQIFGTQFNGLSQANAFGDEFQVATNFPLVRITNNATGDVSYATTHDFSTMGVATGSALVSTWFDVPTDLETGDSKLEVVANGIPSLPIPIIVVAGPRLTQK